MGTVKEWLEGLSTSNTSSELDSTKMQNVLRKVGFPQARVVVGIVYPEGQGPPLSIHSMASMMLKGASK